MTSAYPDKATIKNPDFLIVARNQLANHIFETIQGDSQNEGNRKKIRIVVEISQALETIAGDYCSFLIRRPDILGRPGVPERITMGLNDNMR